MNKEKFIEELSGRIGLDKEKCTVINSIIEDTFLIGNKSKEKMIESFKEKLNIDLEKSEKIYEEAMSIITTHMKDKLKHPFKKQGGMDGR